MAPLTTAEQVLQGLRLPEADRGTYDRWYALSDDDYRAHRPSCVTPAQMESFLPGELVSLATFTARWARRSEDELWAYLADERVLPNYEDAYITMAVVGGVLRGIARMPDSLTIDRRCHMLRRVHAARLPLLVPETTARLTLDTRDLRALRWMYDDDNDAITPAHLAAVKTGSPLLWKYLRIRGLGLAIADPGNEGAIRVPCLNGLREYLRGRIDAAHAVVVGDLGAL